MFPEREKIVTLWVMVSWCLQLGGFAGLDQVPSRHSVCPGDICASEAPGSGTRCGSGFPMHRALSMCLCSFHCCSGQPPAHPFTSLKGPQPLLQHLKRQCLERQWCRNDRQNWSNYCTLFLKAPAIAFFLGGNPSQWLSGSSDFHQLESCISEIILSASFPTP